MDTSARQPQEINDLESLHEELYRILAAVQQSAARCGIDCLVAYGTALGAHRHHALIPWDTDVDVVVPIPQLGMLVNCLRLDLEGSDLEVFETSSTPGYDHLFPRVGKRGIDQNLVHVDLFPLVGTCGGFVGRVHAALAKFVRTAYLLKTANIGNRYAHDRARLRVARAAKASLVFMPRVVLRVIFTGLGRLRSWPSPLTLNLGGSYGGREVVPLDVYFPARQSRMKDIEVRLPGRIQEYLTAMYGDDYMSPPPAEQQDQQVQFFLDVTLPLIRGEGSRSEDC